MNNLMDTAEYRNLPLLPIHEDDVHVWLTFPDEIHDPEILTAYQDIMDKEEKEKCRRYKFEDARHACLITRALARSVLSRYTEKSPESWAFSRNTHGKPEIVTDRSTPPLRFNLSHTKGLIACAVTLGHDIGIDIENTTAKSVNLDVADRFFSPAEVKKLRSFPVSEQKNRFFDYWTLKESYVKARGKGLSFHLDQFSFLLTQNRPLGIMFDKGINDNPEAWCFFRLKPTGDHIAAVAVHKGRLHNIQMNVTKTTPLLNEEPFSCIILK